MNPPPPPPRFILIFNLFSNHDIIRIKQHCARSHKTKTEKLGAQHVKCWVPLQNIEAPSAFFWGAPKITGLLLGSSLDITRHTIHDAALCTVICTMWQLT